MLLTHVLGLHRHPERRVAEHRLPEHA
jgi:hypothetical protein